MGGGEVLPGTSSANSESTPGRAKVETGTELDLCFLLDSTGSMGGYIQAALTSIQNIVLKIVQSEHADVKFGLISYRDHPPQDATYVTKKFAFTSDPNQMTGYLSQISAQGGGDGPEAVTAAMAEALGMEWRPNATKVAVLIADAPPHGLGERGDGFPNGDPEGRDPLQIARQMVAAGISVFVVACEPALSNSYLYAIDFFRSIAKLTGGSLLPLSSASLLPDAIIGGAQEQINLEALVAKAAADAEEQRRLGVAEAEIAQKVHAKWSSAKIQTQQQQTQSLYSFGSIDHANLSALCESDSLASTRHRLSSPGRSRFSDEGHATIAASSPVAPATGYPSAARKRMSLSSFGMPAPADFSFAAAPPPSSAVFASPQQTVSMQTDVISIAQVQQLMTKANGRK